MRPSTPQPHLALSLVRRASSLFFCRLRPPGVPVPCPGVPCLVCCVAPAKVDGPGDKPLGKAARKVLVIANKQYNGEEEIGTGEANAAEAPAPDLRAAVPDDAVFGDTGCIGALETASAEATPAGDSAANAHDARCVGTH